MKIGVYVGSFNPVHKGHLKIVDFLLNKHLDKILMMPTGAYWDKNDLANLKDRINMLKIYENERIIVEDEKNDLPYTYLVMEHLSNKYKNAELHLIIGADNIVNFDKWMNYKALLKNNLIIVARNNIDIKRYLRKFGKRDKYIFVEGLEEMDVSSTEIRNLVKENNYKDIEKLIDIKVLDYITENKLYKG